MPLTMHFCVYCRRAILPAAAFQAASPACGRVFVHGKRRLKAGGSQNWLPHRAAEPQPNREGEEPELRSQKQE